jgi:muramidase (phage lysozyme)
MPEVAYNPYDPTQISFLSSLARGETGTAGTGATFEGYGGVNLATAPTDQYGFPQWAGSDNSHAAGTYQFQPSTWDALAAAHGFSFGNPADQNAAAWTLAQQTYSAKTGGDLETDLHAGKYSDIQSALADVWPSITGSSFVQTITSGGGPNISSANPISADTSSGSGGGIAGWIEKEFSRFGVLIVGGIVVLVALWYLLSQSTGVPSPTETAQAAGKALALAA